MIICDYCHTKEPDPKRRKCQSCGAPLPVNDEPPLGYFRPDLGGVSPLITIVSGISAEEFKRALEDPRLTPIEHAATIWK